MAELNVRHPAPAGHSAVVPAADTSILVLPGVVQVLITDFLDLWPSSGLGGLLLSCRHFFWAPALEWIGEEFVLQDFDSCSVSLLDRRGSSD